VEGIEEGEGEAANNRCARGGTGGRWEVKPCSRGSAAKGSLLARSLKENKFVKVHGITAIRFS